MELETPQKLVQTLVDAGIPQEVIAEEGGTSQATISRILSGKSEDPRFSTFKKLWEFARKVRRGRRKHNS